MNDLRSPIEDRPYRSNAHYQQQEEYVQNEYQEYSRFDRIRYSRWFPLGAVITAVLVFGVIIAYAYNQGSETGVNATTPVVTADTSSYKERPADPGGMDVPFQDAVVFDNLQDKNKPAGGESVESLLPPPEQPLNEKLAQNAAPVTAEPAIIKTDEPQAPAPPQVTAEAPAAGLTTPGDNAGNIAATIEASEPANTAVAETVPATGTTISENMAAPETTTVKTEVSSTPTNNTLAKKLDKTAPASAPAKTRIEAGDYRIQLGSFRDETAARTAWGKFKSQFSSQLGSVTPQFPRADLGDKGVFYRAQGVNLSKTSADELCRSINAAKSGSCIVTR